MALIRKTTFQGSDLRYRAYCDKPVSRCSRCRCRQEAGHSGLHRCIHGHN